MSQENVELLQSMLDPWERGDYSSTEGLHPDIDYVVADGPEPVSGKGLAGLARAWGAWVSAWDDLSIQVDEYRALDDERVLVLARKSGRGKQSGLEIDDMHANALADLGLSE